MVIESDASKQGWGATSQGVRTGGPWSRKEAQMHINCLEALAAFLAVKCFVSQKRNLTVMLRIDNMSAVTYVNKVGGTVSQNLTSIIKELWMWCMQKDITLVAEHLPGVQNTVRQLAIMTSTVCVRVKTYKLAVIVGNEGQYHS